MKYVTIFTDTEATPEYFSACVLGNSKWNFTSTLKLQEEEGTPQTDQLLGLKIK